jgi:hypothetical protein
MSKTMKRLRPNGCISTHSLLVQEESEFERLDKIKNGDSWLRTLMLTNPITFPIVIFRELVLRKLGGVAGSHN